MPWAYATVGFILGCCCSFFLLHGKVKGSKSPYQDSIDSLKSTALSLSKCRPKDYSNIRPLSVELSQEARIFKPLKQDLQHLIDSLKQAGMLNQASVYLREFDQRGWMGIGQDDLYHPASLMKVALLICYLRMAEADPGVLRQEIVFEKPDTVKINPQYYSGPSIEHGKKYTVHELLYYMIAYSDNNATWLLSARLNPAILKKFFTDFCLPEPQGNDLNFRMSAKECSVLFKTIYTSSYLSPDYSEYAAQLLRNCTFKEGFAKGFPEGTKIWHKFGEWRYAGQDYELHEAGVVFIHEKPYLVTVMTKGKDTDKLAESIQAIARVMYLRLVELGLMTS